MVTVINSSMWYNLIEPRWLQGESQKHKASDQDVALRMILSKTDNYMRYIQIFFCIFQHSQKTFFRPDWSLRICHLYVKFTARQYSIPLNVDVSCNLHFERDPNCVLFLDILQQFIFMHWFRLQYRELRLNKLAHAAAALSVALGYNCGMGDIRTTTEAQGKER